MDETFSECKKITEQFGVWKNREQTEETKTLLLWIKRQQKKLSSGQLFEKETQLLHTVGIVPEDDPWMKQFHLAEQYYLQHGNLDIPASYKTSEGIRLGAWISRQRSLYKTAPGGKGLSDLQIQMLESLNIEWDLHRKAFETGLNAIERYYKTNGNLNVPARYVDDAGYPLYQWMCDIRKKKSKLHPEDIAKLDAMEFMWEKSSRR